MTSLILLDKPAGMTSFSAVNRVRHILNNQKSSGIAVRKAGHTGTLDPMATGVLVILTNGAARFIEFLPSHRKAYRAGFQLGITTDTLDITGQVLTRRPVNVTTEEIARALEQFRGKIMQTPPMVSAIKQDGVRLYELARQGKTVERPAREVEIFNLSFSQADGEFFIDVACSAGTYIRTLIDDLGERLGCGAVMTSLRRTEANGYPIERCATLEQLERGEFSALPVEDALSCYGQVVVTAPQASRFRNGGALDIERLRLSGECAEGTLLRVYHEPAFLGLGIVKENQLAIARLLVS